MKVCYTLVNFTKDDFNKVMIRADIYRIWRDIMIRVEIIKDYMEHYKIDSNVNSIEDVAKILVKCKLLDNRSKKYNIIGYSYEELLYNELMDMKEQICFSFMILLEYSLYYEQEDEKLYMIEPIYQAMSFLVNLINKTGSERKKCRYNNVIKTIIKYEKDFYGENLKNYTESQKEVIIRKDLVEHSGEFLFNFEYYRLIDNLDNEKRENYWRAIMRLTDTIDKVGEQKNIKPNKEIEKSMASKALKYLKSKKTEEI